VKRASTGFALGELRVTLGRFLLDSHGVGV
jgi:hypothetical protein